MSNDASGNISSNPGSVKASTSGAVKISLYIVAFVALLWGICTTSSYHLFWGLIKVFYGGAMWLYPMVVFYDMWTAYTGKNSEYQRDFYADIQRDIFAAGVTGLAIFLLYVSSSAKYEASSFDILSTAVPFLVMGMITLIDLSRLKIGDVSLKSKIYFPYLATTGVGYAYIFVLAIHVASGDYTLAASTWIQITILCISLYVFIETKRVGFIMKKRRMEVSPALLALFGPDGVYGKLKVATEQWNKIVENKEKELRASSQLKP